MKRNYKALLLCAGLLALTLFAACQKEEAAPAQTQAPAAVPERHLRLTLTTQNAPMTFNMMRNDKSYDMQKLLVANLYMRIADKETGWTRYVPELADGPPVQVDDAGLVWQIKVQEGHTFDDGYPIDASTFQYTFKMLNDPKLLNRNENSYGYAGVAAYYAGEIPFEETTGFQVIDKYTIQLTYVADDPPVEGAASVMEDWGGFGNSLVHPEVFAECLSADGSDTNYGTTPDLFVASGAYRISDFIDGQYYEFEKRENYNGQVKDLLSADRISWNVVNDDNVALMMYENGEIDQVAAAPVKYNEYPELYYFNTGYVYGIFINPFSEANAVLKDVRFRHAFFWGIDREKIVAASYPIAEPQAYLWPRITRIKDPADKSIKHPYRESAEARAVRMDGHELDQLCYNPERAKAYFDAAYAANGNRPITIEMQYSDAGESATIWAEAIQEHYQTLFGADRLTINLVSVPDQVALESLFRTAMDYEVVAARRIFMTCDDEPWENTNWVSTGHRFSYNTQYCVLTPAAQAEFDRLFDVAAAGEYLYDQAGRNKTSALVEELVLNDCTFIPVYNDRQRLLISPWLSSVLPNGGHPDIASGPFWYEWDDAMYAEAMK